MNIPERGLAREEILSTLEGYKQRDLKWESGQVLAMIYDPGREAREVVNAAYVAFMTENGLDPTSFPSLLKLETEVVRMVANLLRGDERVVGNLTSGGTESIMLAVKTARDKARAERPEITAPEMVVPLTAHPAFHKAAHYLGLRLVTTPFDPETFRADVRAMQEAITKNTVLLAASAPGYSHGVVDSIAEIGALAREHGLLFHVDACVGGLHLSFMRKLGYSSPEFDFSVPGVTSISADLHKYGYSAKGASVILYRNKDIRKYQIFSCSATTVYAVINPTVLSSKSGGPMAGAWAILHYLGEDGYHKIVREVMDATQRMIEGVNGIHGLHVLGKPDMCMFAIASEREDVNVFQLADEMKRRGWHLQPQFSMGASPCNLHVSVNYSNAPFVAEFLDALRASVEQVKKAPPLDVSGIKAMIEQLLQDPPDDLFENILALGGLQGAELPEDMALINAVLNALPVPATDALLTEYFNNLFV
jgi:sphinganine-1-phosphate aldolase